MKEPKLPQEVFQLQKLRRDDPQRFLQIVNNWLKEDPRNFRAYFQTSFCLERHGSAAPGA